MNRIAIVTLALTSLLVLDACEYSVPMHETAETFTIDPATGHLIRTTFWKNSDGGEATTRDDITLSGIDVRRNNPPSTGGLLTF